MDLFKYCILLLFVVVLNDIGYMVVGALLNEPCTLDYHCGGNQKFCKNQLTCACYDGFLTTTGSETCTAIILASCQVTLDCSTTLPHSECFQGLCDCEKAYVPSSDNKACLPQATVYEAPCSVERQCTDAFTDKAECKDGKCVCKPKNHFQTDKCVRNTGVGAECTTDAECIKDLQSNSECYKGECICKKGYVPSKTGQACLPRATAYQSPCVEPLQCTNSFGDKAQCLSNKCVCQPNYHFASGKCVKDTGIGEGCKTDQDCSNVPHSECYKGTCSCEKLYVPNPKKKDECLSVAAYIQAPCIESVQCIGAFGDRAQCLMDKCDCQQNSHFASGACIKNKGPGEPCQSTNECFQSNEEYRRFVCQAGQCSCEAVNKKNRKHACKDVPGLAGLPSGSQMTLLPSLLACWLATK